MKKTQIIDHLRNIRKQFVSWLSIIVIAMLAVIAYLGIRFTAGSLKENFNSFYKESGYRDVQILSTLRFSKENLEEIEKIDGVEKAVGTYSYSTIVKSARTSRNATLLSLDDTINVPRIYQGTYPAKDNECLVEEGLASKMGLKVGDIVYTDPTPYLKQNVFTISGIGIHPDHIAKLMDNAGNNYILLNKGAFNDGEEGFDNSYSSIEIRFVDPQSRDAFKDSYFDGIKEKEERIEDISENQAKIREETVLGKMNKAIDENAEKLAKAKTQLDEARALLDEKQKEADAGAKKLASSYRQLKDGKAQLDAAKPALDLAGGQLANAEQELNEASKQLEDGKKQLIDGYQKFVDIRNSLRNWIKDNAPGAYDYFDWLDDDSFDVDSSSLSMKSFPITKDFSLNWTNDSYLEDLRSWLLKHQGDHLTEDDINKAIDSIKDQTGISGAQTWEEGHNKYLSARQQYSDGYGEFKSQYRNYINNLELYESKLAEYEEGMKAYRSGLSTLNKAKAELAEKEAEYASKEAEYNDGIKALEDARARLSEIPKNRWIFFNIKGNASYVFVKSISNNFSGISITFSLLFVVIGALVIYATVGKTIDEQRTQVGTTKALGFFNSEIMRKYLVFGLSATILGVILGIVLSYFIIVKMAVASQNQFFHLGEMLTFFEPIPVAIVSVAAVLLTILAVYLACNRLVKQPARLLMQPETPKVFKGKATGSGGSLYSKLIVRNMLSDPKRVFVTIFSIAGSCALIFIGLTILHSISSAVELQFEHINQYDFQIDYDKTINVNVEEDIQKILDENGAEYIKVIIRNHSFLINDELDSCRFLIGDLNEIKDYIQITDTKYKKPMELNKEGIYVPIKMDEKADLVKKGKITVFDDLMNSYDADVADSFMLYAARIFIMSRETYTKIYDKTPIDSNFLVKIDAAKAEAAKEAILKLDGVNGIIPSDNDRADFNSFVGLAQAMVMLLTGMAFAMAYFILLNLVNMFINQKKRELTVMRVNGFTVKEVKNYVGKELIVNTAIGILLGLPLGGIMAYRIILLLENINCFDRSIYYLGGLIAAVVTAIFSFFISQSALRKVKDLKLTDV